MRKLMTFMLVLLVSSVSFGQKSEVKAAEKAIKSSNFLDAKSAIKVAEGLVGNMDDKTKAKFYYLKTQAFFANGKASVGDVDTAIESLNTLREFENQIGKVKYSKELEKTLPQIINGYINSASDTYESKNFLKAAKQFDQVYQLSPKDTVYLYYAASSAVNGQEFDVALEKYNRLKAIGYTGVQMQYFAVNAESGKEELFADKVTRDLSVKATTHIKPTQKKSQSKYAEIIKNIALIYVSQGKKEEALAAIEEAKQAVPNDYNLLVSEGNIYLELDQKDKAFKLFEKALSMDKDNPDLNYNVAVISMNAGDNDKAEDYFKRTLALDPSYANAALNLSTMSVNKGNAINDEMNNLGMSAADNKKYEELKLEKTNLFMKGAEILEAFISSNPNTKNMDILSQLKNIYSAVGEMDKFKAMKAKIEKMEAGG